MCLVTKAVDIDLFKCRLAGLYNPICVGLLRIQLLCITLVVEKILGVI